MRMLRTFLLGFALKKDERLGVHKQDVGKAGYPPAFHGRLPKRELDAMVV